MHLFSVFVSNERSLRAVTARRRDGKGKEERRATLIQLVLIPTMRRARGKKEKNGLPVVFNSERTTSDCALRVGKKGKREGRVAAKITASVLVRQCIGKEKREGERTSPTRHRRGN